ncbi:cell division protein ZapE, partial [Bradyrhizobium sp.]|uniref:cell division protein ZapE n=1 Tax=Bradyrhizobium sp. TaxID=376 RepID=UPI00403844F5
MLSTPPATFHAHYKALIASGAIEADPAQQAAAQAFAALEDRLGGYTPVKKQGLFGRLFADKGEPPPRGLYVHGEVGRGKTMLMDLFFDTVAFGPKRRVHFHAFMADVHDRLAIARATHEGDPIRPVALSFAAETRLLCFDELFVRYIADATILGRLFKEL